MPLNAAELMVTLGERGVGSLRLRLAAALRDAVRSGRIVPGTTLPSSRVLAQDLGVSRGVVVDAYSQLAAEGFLLSRPGAATVVGHSHVVEPPMPWAGDPPPIRPGIELDLRPGSPDLSAFPRRAWAAATHEVLRNLPHSELGYVEPWGPWEVRKELVTYLTRVRGAMVVPDGVVMVSGVTQALTLLTRVLLMNGQASMAVEDPSNAIQRHLLGRLGVRLVDVPVDQDGLRVDALAAAGTRVVLCTPAHQYPSGVTLSPRRRQELLGWVRDVDGLIIEDDYDAEFRYGRAPLGCMQGMDPQHVALIGSVSKTLAPVLRLGWVLAPPRLIAAVRGMKRDDDFGGNAIGQHVLARLMASGAYDRHLRAMRQRYRHRRDAFIQAMDRWLPDWPIMGDAGGLHLTVTLPPEIAEARLIAAAAGLGLSVLGLEGMRGSTEVGSGIVISYARATPDMCEESVRRLLRASTLLDEVTPEMEAAAARSAQPWEHPECRLPPTLGTEAFPQVIV